MELGKARELAALESCGQIVTGEGKKDKGDGGARGPPTSCLESGTGDFLIVSDPTFAFLSQLLSPKLTGSDKPNSPHQGCWGLGLLAWESHGFHG